MTEEVTDTVDMISDSDNNTNNTYTARSKDERITGNIILTKYERTRILGSREKQLTLGCKPMIKLTEDISFKEIAKIELELKMTPMIIRRYLPDNTYEDWKISELNQ